ncbi:unnamed protein product [Vitrella brassicaformis CCMP3155]|uniref:VWFA domain-containing protein n=1 Tax=Vitrella brassicaformis (strain CCMP3155) TaxID=1169540 RepID=A0A0G4EVU9_VITBC|nr:unnamed protein product [Vitrella brassicaformis CCMP3155]|eukprot:CEM02327.1 unnamed protein product [Vitrella brassicaformis CCMP3155]
MQSFLSLAICLALAGQGSARLFQWAANTTGAMCKSDKECEEEGIAFPDCCCVFEEGEKVERSCQPRATLPKDKGKCARGPKASWKGWCLGEAPGDIERAEAAEALKRKAEEEMRKKEEAAKGRIQVRTRGIKVEPKNGGRKCPTERGEVHRCKIQPCPPPTPTPAPAPPVTPDKDCVLKDWTDWGECTRVCGGGVRFRYRGVAEPATGKGKCPSKDSEYRLTFSECNTHPCPLALKCRDRKNFIFAIPSSVGETDFGMLRSFVSQLIGRIDTHKDLLSLVGALVYYDENRAPVILSDLTADAKAVQQAVLGAKNLHHPADTSVWQPLLSAAMMADKARVDADNVVVILIDGEEEDLEEAYEMANYFKYDLQGGRKGEIFFVATGTRVDLSDLREYASFLESQHITWVESVDQLLAGRLSSVLAATCPKAVSDVPKPKVHAAATPAPAAKKVIPAAPTPAAEKQKQEVRPPPILEEGERHVTANMFETRDIRVERWAAVPQERKAPLQAMFGLAAYPQCCVCFRKARDEAKLEDRICVKAPEMVPLWPLRPVRKFGAADCARVCNLVLAPGSEFEMDRSLFYSSEQGKLGTNAWKKDFMNRCETAQRCGVSELYDKGRSMPKAKDGKPCTDPVTCPICQQKEWFCNKATEKDLGADSPLPAEARVGEIMAYRKHIDPDSLWALTKYATQDTNTEKENK